MSYQPYYEDATPAFIKIQVLRILPIAHSCFDTRPCRLLPKKLDHGNLEKQHNLLVPDGGIPKIGEKSSFADS